MDKTWVPLPMISLASFHWVKLILPLETHQILRFLYHEVNPILTSNSKIIRLLSIIQKKISKFAPANSRRADFV